MRAVRHTSSGIQLVGIPPPTGPGVRVRVRSAGICGTDLVMTKGGPLPFTLGHEFAGLLDDGTAVAVEPIDACGTCDQCVTGHYQRCRSGPEVFYGIGTDGGLCDEILVPSRCLHPLPPELPVGNACLAEPTAVALHGLHVAGVGPGQRVAVIGGGSIGLLAVAGASAAGAEVDLAARHPAQMEAGERLGAAGTPRGHYDLVIDAAGSASGLATALELAQPGGALLLLAVYYDQVPLLGVPLLSKELTVHNAMAYSHHDGGSDFGTAVELLATHPEIADTLITGRFPLDDAAAAFRAAADRAAGAIKVVLEP
jgi:threonine dehydrogenase-like Zn-dependent dehydrogenase